jgi:hypothetical protein
MWHPNQVPQPRLKYTMSRQGRRIRDPDVDQVVLAHMIACCQEDTDELRFRIEQQQKQIDSLTDTLLQINVAMIQIAHNLELLNNDNRPTAH